MLEVEGLSRLYGDFTAVSDISFAIEKGEIVGLLGHNGAGKTTIMKMLSGYLEPNQGQVRLDGVNVALDPNAAQQGLGYLPENMPLYPEMTVADYLDYAAQLKGLEGDEKTAEIKRVMAATEIHDKLLSTINTLSRGYRQRVGVAQAILGKPKLLILDEPTNGLDPTQTEHMRDLIRDIAEDATVILSTHIMQEVDAVCDRVLILRNGLLAVDESLEALRRSNQLVLHTSLDEGAVSQQLNELAGIASITALPTDKHGHGNGFRLQLTEKDSPESVAAAVAKSIIEGGGELYQLRKEQRDLETLFREVSNAPLEAKEGGVSDAA